MGKYNEIIEAAKKEFLDELAVVTAAGAIFRKYNFDDTTGTSSYNIEVPKESWIYEYIIDYDFDEVPYQIINGFKRIGEQIHTPKDLAKACKTMLEKRDQMLTIETLIRLIPNMSDGVYDFIMKSFLDNEEKYGLLKTKLFFKEYDNGYVECDYSTSTFCLESFTKMMESNEMDTKIDWNMNKMFDNIDTGTVERVDELLRNDKTGSVKLTSILLSGLMVDRWEFKEQCKEYPNGRELYYVSVPKESWIYNFNMDHFIFESLNERNKAAIQALVDSVGLIASPEDLVKEFKKFLTMQSFQSLVKVIKEDFSYEDYVKLSDEVDTIPSREKYNELIVDMSNKLINENKDLAPKVRFKIDDRKIDIMTIVTSGGPDEHPCVKSYNKVIEKKNQRTSEMKKRMNGLMD